MGTNRMWKRDRNSSCGMRRSHMNQTGNVAFDSYRDETLRRLEEEQDNFEAFLKRLRDAKVSSQPKGSAPDYRSRALRSGTTLNLEDSSSSDSSSSSSSSTSSAESDGSTSGAGSG